MKASAQVQQQSLSEDGVEAGVAKSQAAAAVD
jgi:hypothetical protein